MSVHPTKLVMFDFARSLLPAQYRNKTDWEKLLRCFAKPFQDLENAFWQLLVERYVSVAVGKVLDQLGEIVGEPRNGRSDVAYRVRVKARIQLILSSGTVPQILALLQAIKPDGVKRYTPYFPAGFVVTVAGVTTGDESVEVGAMVAAAKSAGVRANVTYSPAAESATFTWNGTIAQGWNAGEWGHTVEG